MERYWQNLPRTLCQFQRIYQFTLEVIRIMMPLLMNRFKNVLQSNNVNLNQLNKLTDAQINNMIDDIEDLSLDVLEDWRPPKLN